MTFPCGTLGGYPEAGRGALTLPTTSFGAFGLLDPAPRDLSRSRFAHLAPIIQLNRVTKRYAPAGVSPGPSVGSPPPTRAADAAPPVLDSVDWEVEEGKSVVIRGESGSGKTTLLNLIAGLDRPTSGEIRVAGHRLNDLDDDRLAGLRRETIGLVFQDYHLEGRLTAAENVALPLLLDDLPAKEAATRARQALEPLGMVGFADKPVALLSGGQCQRVVVARALVRRPRILLADEPTANLDEETSRALFRVFETYQNEAGATLILVSHDRLALDHPGWLRARCYAGKVVFEASGP